MEGSENPNIYHKIILKYHQAPLASCENDGISLESQITHVGLFGAAFIEILSWLSSSSSNDASYSEVMKRKSHLYGKGAGYAGGGSVVLTGSAVGVSEIFLCASTAGNRIGGRDCSTVV